MIEANLIKHFRVAPGKKFKLKDYDPDWAGTEALEDLKKGQLKKAAAKFLAEDIEALYEAQQVLWASDQYSLLLIFQAMDAAGKDSTIKHVMSGVNPQGCQVFSFKQPSNEELDHNFLWRYAKRTPERGRIGIFNRSYYEEVLVVRVHPEWLDKQRLPPGKRGKSFWKQRYEDINNFELHLANSGTKILKFFLNVSKQEQKKRFLERLDRPDKNWKFSPADLTERRYWDDYMQAFEDAIEATSTEYAPWHVIPADHKWVTRAIVADIITATLKSLDLKYPEVSAEQQQALAEARQQLMAEK
jgi:PPK2 family polyphosphate:nucleotide phosphotransferase